MKRFDSAVFADKNIEARFSGGTGEGSKARAYILGIAKTDNQNRDVDAVLVAHEKLRMPLTVKTLPLQKLKALATIILYKPYGGASVHFRSPRVATIKHAAQLPGRQ